MHLAYLNNNEPGFNRRSFIKHAGVAVLGGMLSGAQANTTGHGFKGEGRMDLSTGEDWIDTFFNGGADAIIHYYADQFVFEDVTLFQTINNKADLHRAFLPFSNNGPDSPAGVHQFDIFRYDGGPAGDMRGVERMPHPENYTPELWARVSGAGLAGLDFDYDEWAVMHWVWKATHNLDFLELPAAGRTTHTRGMTFHAYRERKIVREFTFWNFRDVAIQLGAFKPQEKFWLEGYQAGG